VRRNREIVLYTDSAEPPQLLHPRPIDAPAARVGFRRAQKLLDEVDSRLHRDHEAFLQDTGEPQEWMSRWARYVVALFRGTHESPDVMHFEPQEVADAMRQEDARHAGRNGFFGTTCSYVSLS